MSHTYRKAILCLWGLFMSAAVMAHDPTPGLWFSPDHDGHGFDLQRMGDRNVVIFYTYNDEAEPVWYLSVATGSEEKLTGTFSLFEYDADRNPPQHIVEEPGDFTIDFANIGNGSAGDDESLLALGVEVAVLNWNVNGSEGSWCVTP